MDLSGLNSEDVRVLSKPRTSFLEWLHSHLARETSSGRFIPEMDGLRFVAIGMVVLFHLNGYLTVKSAFAGTLQPSSDWLARVALVGFRGVELFFVISGFILGLPFAAHYIRGAPAVNLRKYYLRRLTRLEPPYILALLILFALGIFIQRTAAADLRPHLWASMLYLHNLIFGAASPVMGVAWSLEIEVQFYVLVPVLTLLFAIPSRHWRRGCMVAVIAVLLSVQFLFLHDSPRVSLSILAFLQFFLIGFLLADVFVAEWREEPKKVLAWDLAALAGWPLLFVFLKSPRFTHWLFPFWILFLYCAAFRGVISNRIFANRWITVTGGMCYSIYLLHYEVISAVGRITKRFGTTVPYSLYLVLQMFMVGAAILLACGLYFVSVEKPCMRRDWPQRILAFGRKTIFTRQQAILEGDGTP
jgi:peptidoglycan/LPS O-acetylase OafA/YrhL